jgi:predicted metal-dependent RNase
MSDQLGVLQNAFGVGNCECHLEKFPMRKTKRRASVQDATVMNEQDVLRITPLGAGSEVGRSSHVLQFKGKTVLARSSVMHSRE